MPPESTMRQRIVKLLTAHGMDAMSVENGCCPGTPDINAAGDVWVELKTVPAWPKRPDTKCLLPHFVPAQRIWLKRRWQSGGNCWLLLRVDRDWVLFSGLVAATFLGLVTRDALLSLATAHWTPRLDENDLVAILRRGRS